MSNITFPQTLPLSVKTLAAITIRAHTVNAFTRSEHSGAQQVQELGGDWWEVEGRLPPLETSAAMEWIPVLVSLRGMLGTFHIGDPARTAPRGSASSAPGTPIVAGANQVGLTLTISGAPANASNYLLRGDYFEVGSSASRRLHMVTKNTSASSTGGVTIDFWPRLRESPTTGAAITYSSAQGTFRLAENDVTWDIDTAKIYGLTFRAIEAI